MDVIVVNTDAPVVGATPAAATEQTVSSQSASSVDKEARFRVGAEKQASKILAEIEKLNRFSNRKYYTFYEEQINELFDALYDELNKTKRRFTSDAVEKQKRFTFSA